MKDYSRLVAGVWRLADSPHRGGALLSFIEQCVEMGVTSFDHADIYGDYQCETIFGDALALSPTIREKIQIITKCGIKLVSENRPQHAIKHYDSTAAHIFKSVDNSLACLRTEYIDCLLLHRPDPLMDVDEVAWAFKSLREAGKVRDFGVSNFSPSQFALLASRLEKPLITNQISFSVADTSALEDGTLDDCYMRKISPMVWSPLGGGSIYDDNPDNTVLRNILEGVGANLGGYTADQVALAWVLKHPAKIHPIIGTSKIHRVKRAVDARKVELGREHWFSILSASRDCDVP